MNFVKFQGTGNDFVVLDDRAETFPADDKALIARLCNRRFGIGADGLMLLRSAEGYDFRMVYFNADGAESSMCGNGGRCLIRFAHELGLFQTETRFIAVDGPHEGRIEADGTVSLRMADVAGLDEHPDYCFLNTGSPHVVQFVDNVAAYDVVSEGHAIRHSATFQPGGTNVNFVQTEGETLRVRTFERGVEDETLSCGTGVTAAALAAHVQRGATSPVHIETPGGQLHVSFERSEATPGANATFRNIWLRGPAERVFAGTI